VSWGPKESRFRTEAICFLLLVVFITRAVFDLLQLEIWVTDNTLGPTPKKKDITEPIVFWMYFVWEIFPTTLMLFFFGAAVGAHASGQSAALARYHSRLTLTDSFAAGGVPGAEYHDRYENEQDIIEKDTPNALWPVPKDVADSLMRAQDGMAALEAGHQRPLDLLEDDGRYDSPCDNMYAPGYGPGFNSPLRMQAMSHGYAAATGQPLNVGNQPLNVQAQQHYWPNPATGQ